MVYCAVTAASLSSSSWLNSNRRWCFSWQSLSCLWSLKVVSCQLRAGKTPSVVKILTPLANELNWHQRQWSQTDWYPPHVARMILPLLLGIQHPWPTYSSPPHFPRTPIAVKILILLLGIQHLRPRSWSLQPGCRPPRVARTPIAVKILVHLVWWRFKFSLSPTD